MSITPITSDDAYTQRVEANFPYNTVIGLWLGVFTYIGLGFLGFDTILALMVYDLSRSAFLVGFLGTVSNLAFTVAPIYAIGRFEHLPLRRPSLVHYGLIFRIIRLPIGLALIFLPGRVAISVFLILFFIGEFASGLCIILFFDLMARIIPIARRGTFFGLHSSVVMLVQTIAGYATGLLIGRFSYCNGDSYITPLGYALCFFAAFAAHLVDIALINNFREEPSPSVSEKTTTMERLRSLPQFMRTDPNFIRYCILRGLCMIAFNVMPFITVYVRGRFGITGEGLGTITALRTLSWAVGAYVAGQVGNRFGFKQLLAFSSLTLAISFLATPVIGNMPIFLFFACLNGFLMGVVLLCIDSMEIEFGQPGNRTTYIASSTLISGIAMSIFPTIAGYIATSFSPLISVVIAGVVITIAAILLAKTVVDPRRIQYGTAQHQATSF